MLYTVETSEGFIAAVRWDDDGQGILDIAYAFREALARTFTAKQVKIVKQYTQYHSMIIIVKESK